MNKSYRSLYNEALGAWVAVSELVKLSRKGRRVCGKAQRSAQLSVEFTVKPLALVLAALGTLATGAAYAVCTGGPALYTCTGTTTTQVNLSGALVDVTAGNTFNSTVASNTAVVLTATGTTLNFTQQFGGNIIGSSGISTSNAGTGATNISIAGAVKGTDTYGIKAINTSTATDLTVTQAAGSSITTTSSTNPGSNGISTQNDGTGATRISTAGSVSGTNAYGIYALNNATATDLTVTQSAGAISGAAFGIRTLNFGKGATSITTAGAVTGINSSLGAGIIAYNATTTTDLTVTQSAGSVSGGSIGINIQNYGTGATSIGTAGTVTGTGSTGISVTNGTTTTDLTVTQNAGSISGGVTGINATNSGTGTTSITTAGSVIGTSNYGISVGNNATAKDLTVSQTAGSITGALSGITAFNNGTGSTTVTTAGTVTGGSSSGVNASNNSATTSDLTVTQVAGSISGGSTGINVYNGGTGVTTITTGGTVTSTASYGVSAVNGTNAGGIIVNQTGGSVTSDASTGSGISIINNGTGATAITTAGAVTSANIGIIAKNNSAANTDGITLNQAGGTITSRQVAIEADNYGGGATSITVAGTVTSSNYGINASNGTSATDISVTQTGGSIAGSIYGIATHNTGTGATTVTTAGLVTSTNGIGIYAVNDSTATDLSITQMAGSITDATGGILAFNYGTGATRITTAGTVTGGSSNSGIDANNSATARHLTVTQGSGSISGGYSGISANNLGTGDTTITIGGTVTGTGTGYGVLAKNDTGSGGIIVNQTAGSVITAGTTGTAAGPETNGFHIINNGRGATVITTAGAVTGTNAGILARNNNVANTGGITVNQQAGGSVTSRNNGIAIDNYGAGATRITLAGTVTSTDGDAVIVANGTSATDLSITQTAGSITGNQQGIVLGNNGTGTTTVTTAGGVTSTNGFGIFAYNDSTATDLSITQTAGSITGAVGGIFAINQSTGATTVSTAGTVSATRVDGVVVSIGNTANASALTITQTAGSIITGDGNGIYTQNFGTGATTISSAGTITGGTGAGIFTAAGDGAGIYTTGTDGNIVTLNLNAGADISATTGRAIKDDGGNATVTMENGSKLAGQVLLGNGNDAMIIKGTADISGATLLDGGNSTDSSVTDILGTAGAATNTLSFQGATQSLAGSLMKNWQSVTLDGSKLTFAGDAALVTGTGTNPDGSLQGLVLKNSSTLTSPIALAVTGDVAIDASSTLTHALGGSITGNLTNAGLIYWQNLGQTLTVNGNYTGVSGSKLSLETYLGGDSSATDKLHVTGNTSGTTAITVRPVAGSPGAQTVNGIDVVQVDGTSAAGSFTLAGPVQAGAYQYVLKQGSAVDANNWYLTSTYSCALNGSCPVTPATPTPDTPTPATPIYRPGVANYVSGQTANAEQGFQQLTTLHQRIGEQKSVNADGRQTWVRAYHTTQNNDGETRFGYKQRITGFQIGQEVLARGLGDGGTERAALSIDYANSYASFADRMRPLANLSADTGHMDAQSVALGGYYTRMDKDGGYVDLVGQVSSLRNVFRDSYGSRATQTGWRAALSGEVGRPVAQIGDWKVEPQAQLIYQYTNYQGFSDSISNISGYTADALRGRLGVRLFDNVKTTAQKEIVYYGVANVIHDFNKPSAVTVGTTSVSERFDQTYSELGVGAQGWVAKSTYVYADARYQKSFGGHKDGAQINLGVKIEF